MNARPSSHRRGYTRQHRELRESEERRVATGTVRCARGAKCKDAELVGGELVGGLIRPGDAWDLGHDDYDRSKYSGPEHAGCNRATKRHKPPTSRKRPPEQHPGDLPTP